MIYSGTMGLVGKIMRLWERRIIMDSQSFEFACSQQQLLKRCAARIAAQEDEIQELRRKILEDHQQILDLAVGWRTAMEMPELDMRDDVSEFIGALEDQLAVMQEHIA